MSSRHSRSLFDRVVTQVGVTPLDELLPELLGEIALLLGVERAAYYRLEDAGSAIVLETQFTLSTGRCETGNPLRLTAAQYPGYFAALREPSNLVVSHDVMADPRLIDFQETYFQPLGITSMLDAPVHRSGKLIGVICLEHIGEKRRWTEGQVDMARSVGHLVALAIETRERDIVAEKLRLALEREKELVQMKTNFVNLVSHEFRSPLGVIYCAADILNSYHDRLSDCERAHQLDDIRHSAQQMSGLMEEVLLVGKVESPNMTYRRDAVDLGDFCRRIVDEQTPATLGLSRIQLTLDDIDCPALGDESLLRHIIGNLLSNAVKYSPGGPAVRFTVRRDGAVAELEIQDRGIGIHPEDEPHLFVAFQRGRNAGEIPGTGLGLVIVKQCVTLHEGTLAFQSSPSSGTCFTVRLPLFLEASPCNSLPAILTT